MRRPIVTATSLLPLLIAALALFTHFKLLVRDISDLARGGDGEVLRGKVVHVADGDTIDVAVRERTVRVRLLGIDTPESVRPGTPVECGAKEASAFTKHLLLDKEVRVVPDHTQDAVDRYGRHLGYVYLIDNDRITVQEMILRAGVGRVYVFRHRPFTKYLAFQKAEHYAKTHTLGAWSKCQGDFHSSMR